MADLDRQHRGSAAGRGGYLTSAVVFALITALWAAIVRNDPFYRLVDVSGVRVPLTMAAYLVAMPLAGFLLGSWRFERAHNGGAIGYAGKLVARAVHFIYAHFLIVLFTLAMAADRFFGLNVDSQIKGLDDGMFDLAARFAPWLAAYLAGFNIKRALRTRRVRAAPEIDDMALENEPATAPDRGRRMRAEPVFENCASPSPDEEERGDLGLSPIEPSGSEQHRTAPVENAQPGFLPPQDLDRLRPRLRELR